MKTSNPCPAGRQASPATAGAVFVSILLLVFCCLCAAPAFSADKSTSPYFVKKDPKVKEINLKFSEDLKAGKDPKAAIIELETALDNFRTKKIGKIVFIEETSEAYIFQTETVGKLIFPKSTILKDMNNISFTAGKSAETDKKQAAGK